MKVSTTVRFDSEVFKAAQAAKINFSQTLEDALKDKLQQKAGPVDLETALSAHEDTKNILAQRRVSNARCIATSKMLSAHGVEVGPLEIRDFLVSRGAKNDTN